MANITQLLLWEDQKAARRKGYNRYALPLKLGAANEMQDLIDNGMTPEGAFITVFTPSAEMHRITKALGLRLTVERGQWVSR